MGGRVARSPRRQERHADHTDGIPAAVIDMAEIRRLVVGEWRDAGMTRTGGAWCFAGLEVEWLVTLEGNWLGRMNMIADAAVMPTSGERHDDDYQLRIFAQNLPGIDRSQLWKALNPEWSIQDEHRRDVVRDSARTLAVFIQAHTTVDALREAYRAGDLDGMAIQKDLRERLERA